MIKSVYFSKETFEKIVTLANKFKCNKNKLINLLVELGYEQVKDKTELKKQIQFS